MPACPAGHFFVLFRGPPPSLHHKVMRIGKTNVIPPVWPPRECDAAGLRLHYNPRSAFCTSAGDGGRARDGRPKTVFLSADYSQIEARLMAHFSKDPILIDCFRRGEDPFLHVAAQCFGVDVDEVTADQRKRAKAATYAQVYGGGARSINDQLDISITEAHEMLKWFRGEFKDVANFTKKGIVDMCRESGGVISLGTCLRDRETASRARGGVLGGRGGSGKRHPNKIL